jgi:hypothetical protein
MKEIPLHKAFEKAERKLAEDQDLKGLALPLGAVAAVVRDFQAADMPAVFDVRPGKEGCPLLGNEDVTGDDLLANGTVTLAGIKFELVIQRGYYNDHIDAKIFRGDEHLLTAGFAYDEEKESWSEEEAEDDERQDQEEAGAEESPSRPRTFRERLAEALVEAKARQDFFGRFSVAPDDAEGALEKHIGGPQVKLRRDGPR